MDDDGGGYNDGYDDGYDSGFEAGHDAGWDDGSLADGSMSEDEAMGVYGLAFSLGLGEEIGLEEAENMQSIRELKRKPTILTDAPTEHVTCKGPRSLKERKESNDSPFSALTGKLKSPFEQWIKDVVSGRKTVHDPVGGNNSYGL